MKRRTNLRKCFGIIALAAVIGLSMMGCNEPNDSAEPTLTGIAAVYTGGSVAINTDVNSLKSNLTVTAKYSDNTGKTLNAADYSLSGDLSASGQKTVTVSYEGETTTFNVTVTATQNNDITYTATQTGGTDGTATSTGIVFTFSASVDSLNLSAANITVSGAAAKGASAALTGTGTSLMLAPITVNSAGLATVAIAKEGIEAVQKSVTIYQAGAYVPEYWSITWHLDGGAEGTGAYPTQIVKGTVLDKPSPDPTKAGSTFSGWYSDSGLAQPYTFANLVTTDLNLYAKWVAAPTITPNNPITLTENQWADGNIPTSDDEQWFTFTATASTQYIHASFGTLDMLYVQVYDSGGATVGNQTIAATSISRSLTVGQTYYIRVRPYSGSSGTYQIGFTASSTEPNRYQLPSDAIPLTENQWADGNLPTSNDRQWFVFTATASTQYIHAAGINWNGIYVQVYDSSGAMSGSETRMYSVSGSTDNTSRSLAVGETYYIRVRWYSGSGIYQIGFNTSTTTPLVQLPTNAIPLTANQWVDGSIPTSSDVQWFTFTATASTQWIHFDATGTLKYVYVQVYDSSGAAVGSETNLYSITRYTSRTLTVEQTYYIRVRPNSSTNSGTYRIGFNTSTAAPGASMNNAIPLTENQWANGNLPSSSSQQWFTLTTTASTQWIHADFGTLESVDVHVYNSGGATVGSDTLWNTIPSTSLTLTSGQTYYIMVEPYTGSGTYRIGFNATPYPPGTTLITLTVNQWADGNIPEANGQQWFTFTATASTQWIHADFGTLESVDVQVYNSGGTDVGNSTTLYSSTTNTFRTLAQGQTYYIRVNSTYSGTYRIGFTASLAPPGTIPLTANIWSDGSLPTSTDVQWFTFTATATTQYIHVSLGTLTNLYVQVYDSGSAEVGAQTTLNSSTTSASRSLIAGQTYYIRVWPYNSIVSGTYRIAFNTSATAPTL